MWEYQFSVVSMPNVLHIEKCRCVQTLSCLITYSFFARMGHPDVRWSIVSSYSLHIRHLLSISSFKIFLLKVVFTDCLILSCHNYTLCLFLNVSKLQPSVGLFIVIIIFILKKTEHRRGPDWILSRVPSVPQKLFEITVWERMLEPRNIAPDKFETLKNIVYHMHVYEGRSPLRSA
jgi:hypothetical protein